ncbi:unnamed protein product [Rhodiola kirilowii]
MSQCYSTDQNIPQIIVAESRPDAPFLPGSWMIFFILNVIEFIGLVMTFKPFIALSTDS